MKSFYLYLAFLILLVYYQPCLSSSSSSSLTTSKLFEEWCEKHGKSYPSEEERLYRLGVFEDNLDIVNKHNNFGNSSYTLSLNVFADLTHHEFIADSPSLSPSLQSSMSGLASDPLPVIPIPASLDWRTKGAVTNVKFQGLNCDSCWAFSAIGAIEGINKIVTGSLVSLSEQELVDCISMLKNSGCKGRPVNQAFSFIIKNNGIDTEQDYPYQAMQMTCDKEKLKKHVVTIDGFKIVPRNDENQLLQAVARQPVSVTICKKDLGFQLYNKGIFKGPCATCGDHAMLIVGYGSEKGVDYWIVKNSWGPKWGINGYMYMQRNTGDIQGLCGINQIASYPTKAAKKLTILPNPYAATA